ncbi:MAG TPA: sodium:proton antiporter [Steroidobacteraceae bacterium]|nr:sodium:proton antiporter [Steroidobacteraceae bacterium]
MNLPTTFILLFVVATAVAIGAQRLRVPYTVALVLTGVLLGATALIPAPHLTKNLLFSLFLPGLIFEAAFRIDSRDLRTGWITSLLLAVPGVIASTALIACTLPPVLALSHAAAGVGWRDALVFGALISATDPVAVIALFRTLRAPPRLTLLLEAESLLNDGTAIVFFTLSLSLIDRSMSGAGALLLQFLVIVGGGLAIGAALGAAASLLMRHIDHPMIEIALTTVAAYGSFALAETLTVSGVIATVVAGLICGNVGARIGMSPARRLAAATFWEYVAFALNSIVFLLIGFEVRERELLRYWLPILVAYLLVTGCRGLIIAAGQLIIGATRERFPWRWSVVLTWGGVRGALAMVLALGLPPTFAYRELLIAMTFGVAILSILVQGLTMSPLLGALGMAARSSAQAADGA